MGIFLRYRVHGSWSTVFIISESVVLSGAGVPAVQGTPQALVSRVQKRKPDKH